MAQRFYIDIRLMTPDTDDPETLNSLEFDNVEGEVVVVLGRHAMPSEIIPEGHQGPLILAYGTALEFLELLHQFMRGEGGAAEMVPLQHFLEMVPFDHDRVKIHLQYNVAVVREGNQTPAFVVPFEELAREIILFAIGVYESLIELRAEFEAELEMLNATIDETKSAVEEYLGLGELLNLPPDEEENVE
ncbi:MAG TPA: hypothetical protein VKK79_17815 [Candidatus Lokiarchaeia archaeon]|nr:hypothetical protein [Candidatus Lokiarchaeia archaeon]